MHEWPRYTLGDLIRQGHIVVHKDGNHGSNYPRIDDFVSDGIPFLTAKSISGWQIDIENAPRLSREKAGTFKFGFLKTEDVLLSHNATVGRVSIVPPIQGDIVIGTSLTQFRVNPEKLSPRFLALYLSSQDFQEQLSFVMSQTTRNQVPITEQRRLNIRVPTRKIQESISDTMFSLIDKIDLNRRMNETLEAMARAIFKDWFVDFGPTRAKMEGRLPYLAPDLWALFPDRLDEEGKPEGWEATTLQEVVSELRRGISPSYAETGGVRVLNQKCIRDRSVSFGSARRHDVAKRSISGRELMIGDVLINSTGVGTLGRAAQIWDVDELTVVDSHVTVVRADPQRVSTCYLSLDLTGREHEIEALGEGSTGQTELSRVRLGGMPILLPGAALNAHLEIMVHPLLQRINSNRRENLSLAGLRDLLLPKLMSGEIRVREAESLMGAVV